MPWRSIVLPVQRPLVTALLICLTGCAGAPADRASFKPRMHSARADFADSALIKQLLYSQLREWRGVKYRLGGLSKAGIDCSGFTYLTFLRKFGVVLPRTTRGQVQLGRDVAGWELRPGDLVFFKTGPGKRHVGIFIDKRRFIHASTSRGVTMSGLDEAYWAKHSWKFRRIGHWTAVKPNGASKDRPAVDLHH
jgi:cell wall-associated NlpC family hydrolase